MTVYAILLPVPQPALAEAITAAFGDAFFLSDTQWLVSSPLSVYEVSAKIRLYDPKNPQGESLGTAVVFATSSYYGKAPATLWDWLKVKLEAHQNG